MDEDDYIRRKAFAQVKESCVALSRLSMVETSRFDEKSTDLVIALKKLHQTLVDIKSPYLVFDSSFGDYVFLPLSHILQHKSVKPLNDRTTELLLKIISFLINYCWNVQLKRSMAKEFLILIVSLVSIKDRAVSNETKQAACLALNELFRATYNSPDARVLYTDLKQIPVINFTIVFVLDHCFLEGDGELKLQLLALETLTRLFFDLINDGEVLATMLPGAMSTLCKSLSGVSVYGKTRHFKCVSASINFLRELLVHVFSDDALTCVLPGDKSEVNFNQIRTKSWLKFTKEQVKISLNQISKLRSTNRQDILISLLLFSKELLNKTPHSLDNCMFLVMDTLALLVSNSEYTSVSDGAKSVISDILVSGNQDMNNLLLKRVDAWIDSLPRLLVANDDVNTTRLLNSIKSILGLLLANGKDISILKNRLVHIVCDSVTLTPRFTKIHLNDMTSSERGIQISDNQLRQLATNENTDALITGDNPSFASLSLTNYVTPHTQKSVESLFEFLGSHISSATNLLETFLAESIDSYSDSSKLVSMWLGLSVLKGFISRQKTNIDDWFDFSGDNAEAMIQSEENTLILSGIIHELGELYNSTLECRTTDPGSEAMICFALRGMGLLSQLLEKSFKNDLVDYLYPIINHISDSSQIVAECAHDSIVVIASSCGYASVRELLFDNMDYIIDTISIKLQTLDISLQAPLILTSLIKLSGPSITIYFDDLVASMFVILDDYHGYSKLTESIFQVFKALVQETNAGNKDNILEPLRETTESDLKTITNIDSLILNISCAKKRINVDSEKFGSHPNAPFSSFRDDDGNFNESGISDDELREEGENHVSLDNEEEQELEKWTSPVAKPSYMIIHKITNYALNFLTHQSSSLRFNLLLLIISAVPVLSTQKTEFLPTINNLWPSVVKCLSDSEEYVVISAVEVIELFCTYSDEAFMLGRMQDVWPLLKALLPFDNHNTKYSNQSLTLGNSAYQPVDSNASRKVPSSARITSAVYSALSEAINHVNLPLATIEDIINTNAPMICSGGDLGPKTSGLRLSIYHKYGDLLWLYDCINQPSLQAITAPTGNLSGLKFQSIVI
ncbi:hypothetical protein NADFUDRAFT_51692 [Nadsonia fulvescens var. elongata DSM 6958]|uniref:ARM repeat-containing protein n=1 Tax=Nadsonia fulvescens var. elongata DSM 6958 TaxID=857566 RepID=A0A1E3PJI1_9ASCO|nr:hypothetical protein NADFUDRAFT_51692 [Nadsonia fulvescens var. elongata DSM 6958]